MGSYNTIICDLQCPRCGAKLTDIGVECKFGFVMQMLDLHIGDEYPWVGDRLFKNGGRPKNGDVDAEGYVECPSCGKDFFAVIQIRNDAITRVYPDVNKHGYIPE